MLSEKLDEATVIFAYLIPKGLTRIEQRIRRVVDAGTCRLVICNMFRLPGWTPLHTITYSPGLRLYVYDVSRSSY